MDVISPSVRTCIESIARADKDLCESLFRIKNGRQNAGRYLRKFVFDGNHRFLHFSPIAAEWLGITAEEAKGKNGRELGYDNILMDSFEQALSEVFRTGEVTTFEGSHSLYTNGSSIQHFEFTLTPLYGDYGTVEAVVSVMHDITRQKTAEQQSANQVKFLEQLIENAPFGILVIDSKEVVQYHNRAYRELRSAGFQEIKSWVGKPIRELAEAIGYLYDYRQAYVMKALRGEWNFNERTSGFGREWLAHYFPIKDVEERIVAGIAIFHDISELVALQEKIHRIDRLNLVGEMAAGVAHEIRNPMTVIKGYMQVLRKNLPANILDRVDLVLTELERVEMIITDFLSLARIKTSEKQLVSLTAVIEEIVPLIFTDAMKKGVDLENSLSPDMPPMLLDVKEIKQLILNLSRNGIESIQGRGKMRIETAYNANELSLSFSDTGKGIPPSILPKIFNPFFSTKENGTGLGLAICANIVERHGGTIQVVSEEGRGTKVTVSLPRVAL